MPIVTAAECAVLLNIAADDATLAAVIAGTEHSIINHLRYNPVKTAHTEFYPINRERYSQVSGDGQFDSINGQAVQRPSVGSVSGDVLILKNRPVWNDSTLEVREQSGAYAGQAAGSFGSGTVLAKGIDYWLDAADSDQISNSGILYRIGGHWCIEPGSIKVTYNAGYATADIAGTGGQKVGDIKLATIQAVIWNYKQIALNAKSPQAGLTSGPLTMEKVGPYTYRTSEVQSYNFTNSLPPSALTLLQPHRSYAGVF